MTRQPGDFIKWDDQIYVDCDTFDDECGRAARRGRYLGAGTTALAFATVSALAWNSGYVRIPALDGAQTSQRVPAAVDSQNIGPTAPPTETFTPAPTESPSESPSESPTDNETSQTATAEPSPSETKPERHTVLLDPGHNGKYLKRLDEKSGLVEASGHNTPETEEVFSISRIVGAALTKNGVYVKYTKQNSGDTISQRDRAEMAAEVDADLVASIHTDHSVNPLKRSQLIPKKGQKRSYNGTTVTYDNPTNECLTREATKLVILEREANNGGVKVTAESFKSHGSQVPGDITLVQLWGAEAKPDAPWIYSELGAKKGSRTDVPLSGPEKAIYARGLAKGILHTLNSLDDIKRKCGAN
ncbi:hypothetical protein CR983_01550 [Candidatus Saccharibacteria bacterium]|nr:MAG: hypothetical protein CR983_01550 [Candidatus Saccharibacteria bacterium]